MEDLVYANLGLLLAVSAVVLLGTSAYEFPRTAGGGSLTGNVVALLDKMLLVLPVVELLYTVSFREHAIVPEPFLLVDVIAAIRRVLVLTAEIGHPQPGDSNVFVFFVTALAVLTVLILLLAISLLLLRKSARVRAAG
ncbi:MAG TPA: phosphate-starvation-inducible PsiE family protein [Candidatus Binatia bacterium]|nr:phosphate-starvation-inducible PsiE family protein [Candidatus Binatia bacterium]